MSGLRRCVVTSRRIDTARVPLLTSLGSKGITLQVPVAKVFILAVPGIPTLVMARGTPPTTLTALGIVITTRLVPMPTVVVSGRTPTAHTNDQNSMIAVIPLGILSVLQVPLPVVGPA